MTRGFMALRPTPARCQTTEQHSEQLMSATKIKHVIHRYLYYCMNCLVAVHRMHILNMLCLLLQLSWIDCLFVVEGPLCSGKLCTVAIATFSPALP